MRVVIAGGGVAGLEAMLALRDLAGDLVDIELLSPEPHFWYRPMSVAEPFEPYRVRRFDLAALTAAAGVSFARESVASVDPEARRAWTSGGRELAYDALVIACGTCSVVAFDQALTFRGHADVEAFRTLLAEVEAGQVRRLAFALPRRAGWPLPLYELALLTAARVAERGVPDIELSVVTPERRPLSVLGGKASEAVARLLAQSGITLRTGHYPLAVDQGQLALNPSGSLTVDRVVSLARLEGDPIPGIPHDRDGFIATDQRGRVDELKDVYAAGDITRFPIKQGGIATQQADIVAEQIAARAGATVANPTRKPVLRALLLTGYQPLYMETELAPDGKHSTTVSTKPLWTPSAKIAGRYLAPFLATRPHDTDTPEPTA